jgi:hypothetical protein
MVQCPNCKVEVEENASFCSLCGEPLLVGVTDNHTFIKSGRLRREEKMLTDFQKLSGFQKRKIFWKISGLILFSGVVITLLIDFVGQYNITWSKYPALVSLVLYINITLNTFRNRRIFLMMTLSFISVIFFFIAFDIFARESGWKLHLGIPLIILAYLTVYFHIFLVRRAKQKGLNIIAYSLIAVGLLGICTEGIISVYSRSFILLEWSLIVLASVLFIAILLLYIHFRLKKATDLQRFFHI